MSVSMNSLSLVFDFQYHFHCIHEDLIERAGRAYLAWSPWLRHEPVRSSRQMQRFKFDLMISPVFKQRLNNIDLKDSSYVFAERQSSKWRRSIVSIDYPDGKRTDEILSSRPKFHVTKTMNPPSFTSIYTNQWEEKSLVQYSQIFFEIL